MSPKALALDRLLSRRMSYAENMWADVRDWGGVGARRLMRAEGGSLGGSIWELQPGGSQFVYHFHHGSEELIVVLRGEPTVRLHDGDRPLREGDVMALPRALAEDHHVLNDGREAARILIVSTNARPTSPSTRRRQRSTRVGERRVGVPSSQRGRTSLWLRLAKPRSHAECAGMSLS
jgi:quercetin dioxygenase-like cupin family protein